MSGHALAGKAAHKESEARSRMAVSLTPRWGFIFRSVRNYMSDWTDHWQSDDVLLWKNEPGHVSTEFTFASPHFNRAKDMYELKDYALSLKAVLDGAMMLGVGPHVGGYDPFTLGMIIDLSDQHRREGPNIGNVLVESFDPLLSPFPADTKILKRSRYEPEDMILQARQDPVALGMLKHLGFNGPDYRTLYSLLDWMESEGWTEKQVAAVTKQDAAVVKTFTGTANNVTILGPLGRHGAMKSHSGKAPKSIMSLSDAQGLILPAAKAFLQSRAEAFDATGTWPVYVQPPRKKGSANKP